ncbi:MAG TPA: inorganic diphosphatase [Chloroflexota bacterium]|nr:inorganic diphosphatase [Chloroflexota bacterium]
MRLGPVAVMVEIPRGSRNKYEYDPATGRFRLDRVLFASVHYPTDYGFVPDTLAVDGDPLDALVVVNEPTFPGCIVPARPIGVLAMRDEKGTDDKLLTVPEGDPRFHDIVDVADLSPNWLAEIEYFFTTYKTLERKKTQVTGWHNWEAAERLIQVSRARFLHR